MSARRPRRTAPTPRIPRGILQHLLTSDGGTSATLELYLPIVAEPAPSEAPALALVRIDIRRALERFPGIAERYAGGWETFDCPVELLEDVAEELQQLVALARHHRVLPADAEADETRQAGR